MSRAPKQHDACLEEALEVLREGYPHACTIAYLRERIAGPCRGLTEQLRACDLVEVRDTRGKRRARLRSHLVCVGLIGITHVGKTTLINEALSTPWLGVIEVGKEFRRRYRAGKFKGKGAMRSTETEAWDIFAEQYANCVRGRRRVVLCDGQPRMAAQVRRMREEYGPVHVLMLHADDEVLRERTLLRDHSPADQELTRQRLRNDRIQLYDVLGEWHTTRQENETFCAIRTDQPGWERRALDHLRLLAP